MPEFEKSTGYKMKGSTFYGHGKSSPAKVSDDAVVEAQDKLDEIQDGYREPGWSKAARKVFSPMGAGSIGGGSDKSTPETKGTTEKSTNVQENASNKMLPETKGTTATSASIQENASNKLLPEDYKLGDLSGGAKL